MKLKSSRYLVLSLFFSLSACTQRVSSKNTTDASADSTGDTAVDIEQPSPPQKLDKEDPKTEDPQTPPSPPSGSGSNNSTIDDIAPPTVPATRPTPKPVPAVVPSPLPAAPVKVKIDDIAPPKTGPVTQVTPKPAPSVAPSPVVASPVKPARPVPPPAAPVVTLPPRQPKPLLTPNPHPSPLVALATSPVSTATPAPAACPQAQALSGDSRVSDYGPNGFVNAGSLYAIGSDWNLYRRAAAPNHEAVNVNPMVKNTFQVIGKPAELPQKLVVGDIHTDSSLLSALVLSESGTLYRLSVNAGVVTVSPLLIPAVQGYLKTNRASIVSLSNYVKSLYLLTDNRKVLRLSLPAFTLARSTTDLSRVIIKETLELPTGPQITQVHGQDNMGLYLTSRDSLRGLTQVYKQISVSDSNLNPIGYKWQLVSTYADSNASSAKNVNNPHAGIFIYPQFHQATDETHELACLSSLNSKGIATACANLDLGDWSTPGYEVVLPCDNPSENIE